MEWEDVEGAQKVVQEILDNNMSVIENVTPNYEVNKSRLARLMLDWEELRRSMDSIEEEIKRDVLQLGKTQVVGNVRATYNNPRKTYDYEGSAEKEIDNVTLESLKLEHKKVVYDWKEMCNVMDVEVSYTEGQPSVTLKLED
jgi:hypothetical protein